MQICPAMCMQTQLLSMRVILLNDYYNTACHCLLCTREAQLPYKLMRNSQRSWSSKFCPSSSAKRESKSADRVKQSLL